MKNFEENQFPPPFVFRNSLTGEDLSSEDYQHAMNVWQKFNVKKLRLLSRPTSIREMRCATPSLSFQNIKALCAQ